MKIIVSIIIYLALITNVCAATKHDSDDYLYNIKEIPIPQIIPQQQFSLHNLKNHLFVKKNLNPSVFNNEKYNQFIKIDDLPIISVSLANNLYELVWSDYVKPEHKNMEYVLEITNNNKIIAYKVIYGELLNDNTHKIYFYINKNQELNNTHISIYPKNNQKSSIFINLNSFKINAINTPNTSKIKLLQLNFPDSLTGHSNMIDQGNHYITKQIKENEIAWITSKPQMPDLVVSTNNIFGDLYIDWEVKILSERPERKELDNIKINRSMHAHNLWHLTHDLKGLFIGGKVEITYLLKDMITDQIILSSKLTFKIRGKNPTNEEVIHFVKENTTKANIFINILRHESYNPTTKTFFNQFNISKNQHFTALPNKGRDNDWGIGQLNRCGTNGIVTTNEVYNWHENVKSAINIFETKYKEILNYYLLIKDNNKLSDNVLERFITVGNHTVTSHDIAAIIAYNGLQGCYNKYWYEVTTKDNKKEKKIIYFPLEYKKRKDRVIVHDNIHKYWKSIKKMLEQND